MFSFIKKLNGRSQTLLYACFFLQWSANTDYGLCHP